MHSSFHESVSGTALPAPPIRLLVVDDHPMIRAGIAEAVSSQDDLAIAGECEDGAGALQAWQALRPDVTIMDIAMPGMDGLEALAGLRRAQGDARVIVLTTLDGDHQLRRAVELGAAGILMKSSLRRELFDAIRAVHAGGRWIPAGVARTLAERLGQPALSEREIQVLRGAADGNGNREIAALLGIAEDTVKAHVRTILAKLDARDRTHAVAIALKRGILTL